MKNTENTTEITITRTNNIEHIKNLWQQILKNKIDKKEIASALAVDDKTVQKIITCSRMENEESNKFLETVFTEKKQNIENLYKTCIQNSEKLKQIFFYLQNYLGFSLSELANILNISVPTAQKLLRKKMISSHYVEQINNYINKIHEDISTLKNDSDDFIKNLQNIDLSLFAKQYIIIVHDYMESIKKLMQKTNEQPNVFFEQLKETANRCVTAALHVSYATKIPLYVCLNYFSLQFKLTVKKESLSKTFHELAKKIATRKLYFFKKSHKDAKDLFSLSKSKVENFKYLKQLSLFMGYLYSTMLSSFQNMLDTYINIEKTVFPKQQTNPVVNTFEKFLKVFDENKEDTLQFAQLYSVYQTQMKRKK